MSNGLKRFFFFGRKKFQYTLFPSLLSDNNRFRRTRWCTFVHFFPIKTGQKLKPLVVGPMLCEGVHENRDFYWTKKKEEMCRDFVVYSVWD